MKNFLSPVFCLFLLFPGFRSRAQEGKIIELGQQTFQMCIACHGPDGKGVKAGELSMAPSLYDSAFIKRNHLDLITAIVLKGIQKEDNQYIQAMLPLEAALNDEQIAALVSYVARQFGEDKKALVKPADVSKWRQTFQSQTSPYKRNDLEDLLKAASAPKLLSEMTYQVYKGEGWKKLPDFSTMEAEKKGKLPKNRISLDPAKDFKSSFGVVFEAKLTVPTTEEYLFTLSSDDGAALAIDGEGVIDNDGIHPNTAKTGKEKLEAGIHTLKVLYFDGGGQRALSLSAKTKSLGEVILSSTRPAKKGKAKSYDPIPLTAAKPGEAIVHRAFLADAKPRAIGVGYPGAVNLVWDADVLNLAYVWRGEFIDAANHWNGRGSGSQVLGQDRVKTAHGLPFQMLQSLDEPWIPFSEAKIKYERDVDDPQKEITFNIKHPDYQFRGYRLDKNRFPTFRYDYQDLEVTDSFTPQKSGDKEDLVRTVSITGTPGENIYFRVADTGSLAEVDGWFDIGNKMKIRIEGADTTIRQSGGKKELLVPITSQSDITITYRWNEPLAVKN